jgi:hypothetical protein
LSYDLYLLWLPLRWADLELAMAARAA